MQTSTPKIQDLFSLERRYVVPLFQRPYVWGEPQWEGLWGDIQEMAELQRTVGGYNGPPHFLGAIVLQGAQAAGSHIGAFQVIDGQQRLTTFQLFLSALACAAERLGVPEASEAASDWVRNRRPRVDKDVEQWKVWPTRRDQGQYLKAMMASDRDALAADFPERDPKDKRRRNPTERPRMVAAWIHFYDAITRWATTNLPSGLTTRDRLGDLLTVLQQYLQIVQIDLTANENPQVIFETLNGRGVPLLAADLLRNNIFQRAGSIDEADRLYETYWRTFESPVDPLEVSRGRWWDQEERQGRLTRARLDIYLQHYLALQTEDAVRISDLFNEYKKWIEGSAKTKPKFASVEEELATLTRYAGHFKTIVEAQGDTPVGRFAARIRAMDQTTIFPLVLKVLDTPSLSAADRHAILKDLESFLVRRMVCDLPSAGYNRFFLQLLSEFEKLHSPNAASFRALLARGDSDVTRWPDDSTFKKNWCEIDAYKVLRAGRVMMILVAVEEAMHPAMGVRVVVQDLSVEHVMPQEWREHWPLPNVADEQVETDVRQSLVHDFGNLTLVTPPFNSKLSNRSPAVKLPEIDKNGGPLALNNDFRNGRVVWTEQDIRDRGEKLFGYALKVWPGP